MYKNVASQQISVFAIDITTGQPVTGDSANITGKISKDGGASASTNDTNPTELDSTNHPGRYIFDLTQSETNANMVCLKASSATANVWIRPIEVRPLDLSLAGIASADVTKWSGTAVASPSVAGRPSVDAIAISGSTTAADNVELAGLAYSTTRGLSGTALPAAAADAAGGLPISDAGGLDMDTLLSRLDASITSLNNLSALANLYGSPLLEIPDSSSTDFAFTLVVRDNEGKLKDLDSSPTITAANAAGTDRSANLSAVSHPATGRYTFTYSVASDAAEESLRITCSGAISAEGRYVEWIGAVVNFDSLTTLLAIKAKTDNLPASPAAVGSAMTLADGAITDAKFTTPAVTGVPSGIVGFIHWMAARLGLARVTKSATDIVVYRADGTTPRSTNAYTSVGDDDDVGAAS